MSMPQVNGPATEIAPAGFLVGPTGTGKSSLAIELATALDAEIVNADSRLFYRGLDIGTAKPTAADRARIRHHLIDIREADSPLDVAEYLALARQAFADIAARGRKILVVGGSGLYLRVLQRGICTAPPASRQYREHLRQIADRNGINFLHNRLAEIDPIAAARIGRRDLVRISRALEVFHLTGVPLSTHQARDTARLNPHRQLVIGLTIRRQELYEALDRRFDAMIAAGLIGEVRDLLARGYRLDRPQVPAIGYAQIAAYLEGRLSLDEAISLARRATRRLAKRQITWFRAENDIIWLEAAQSPSRAVSLLAEFFSGLSDKAGAPVRF
jgi:tRNA dimethylallyltransferase